MWVWVWRQGGVASDVGLSAWGGGRSGRRHPAAPNGSFSDAAAGVCVCVCPLTQPSSQPTPLAPAAGRHNLISHHHLSFSLATLVLLLLLLPFLSYFSFPFKSRLFIYVIVSTQENHIYIETQMSITVKLVNGSQKDVEVPDLGITVVELRKLMAPVIDIPADEQRIVLRGKILKDSDVLSTVGLEHGNAVHVVRNKKRETPAADSPAKSTPTPPATSAAPPAGSANTASSAAPGTSSASSTSAPSNSNPYAALLSGAGAGAGVSGAAQPGMGMGFPPGMGMGMGMGMDGAPQTNMEQMNAMMQNPAMMQMMAQMMQNPQMREYIIQTNPMLANMSPEQQQMTIQLMSNPALLSALFSAGAGGGGAQNMSGAQVGGNAAMPAFPASNPVFAPPQPQGNPREIYREQLDQLREMGFPNEEANIAALQQCQGNIHFAIERLFNA